MKDAAGNNATDVHNQGDPNTGQGPIGDLFLDADNVWGNGSYTDRASAAVDAQYGAEKTFDYYKNVLGRNGIWNNGVGARSRVHFGNGMVNAFWDGTQMSYGDGAAPPADLGQHLRRRAQRRDQLGEGAVRRQQRRVPGCRGHLQRDLGSGRHRRLRRRHPDTDPDPDAHPDPTAGG